jgi:hypothetical protein
MGHNGLGMAIVILLVVVVAAMLLVRLLQNRPDTRGMADHRRAMEALHKLAGPPVERQPSPAVQPVSVPVPAIRPALRRPPAPRSWRRPALVAGLAMLVGTAVAGITTASTGSHRTRVATTTRRAPTTSAPTNRPAAPVAPAPTPLQPAAEQTTALQPAKADARTADYVIANAPFSIVVTAGGPCWLQVRNATGQVLFTGTLTPGQIQTFSGDDLRLRLGAAGNVTLQVNGSSLVVPVKTPDPYSVRVAQTA